MNSFTTETPLLFEADSCKRMSPQEVLLQIDNIYIVRREALSVEHKGVDMTLEIVALSDK